MRKVIKGLGLSLLILSGVFCLFSCNDEIIPPVIEATPSVRGTISLPASSGLFPENIWVKVVENETTKYVGRVNPDATFSVSGLDAAKKYDVMFTSIEPEQQNVSRGFESRAVSTTNGFGGWLSDVSASIDDANIGSVKIKPLGTINGKAIRSGAVDNYDVMVYIPGTSFMAMSNEYGSFSIANVPQGTHRLRYTSDDYMSQMKEKVLLFSDDDTVNPVTTVSDVILIKNAGILKGYATLNGAASNAGIIIKLEGDNATGSEIGTTASDGSFSIPDVKPGIYSALFSYAGYIDEKVENLVIEAAKTTSLPSSVSLIANGGTITGTVRQNDGAAGTGASVMAKVTIGEADFTYSSTVDADGKFTLNDCRPADGYSITVSKTGFASVVRSGISLTVEGIVLPEIVLSSEFGGLSGYVQDSEMNAINGAQINIGDYTAFTNSEGYFIKSDLPLGQYTITVSKDGYTTKTLAQKVSIESNKTATIGEQMLTSMYGSINGTIALNDGKSPEGATVTAASADGRNSYPATAASDGTYSISNVLPATYTLSVIKEGYEAGSKTISVTADYTTAAGTITLESLYGSLKVLVNYADKDPDDKITVSIRNGESSIRTATTSNSSTLIFDDIPVGAGYVVAASALGYSSSEKTSVSVISNTETTVQLDDLSNRYGSVSGTVQASSGSPLSGALVLLKGTSEYTATTDGNGAFAKDGIGIGSYEVTISKDGYGTLKLATAVSVESSKVTSIGTQKLTPTTAVISGSAAYADKTDSTGIAITLVDSAEQPVDSFTTTSDGQYTFSNVLPGTYKVKAGATGYSAVEKSITVAAGQGYTVALDSLTSIYGKITGTVKLQGAADYSAIQVTATGVEVYHAQTTAGGAYAIANVVPGTYALKYEKSGFLTEQNKSAAVVAGASAGVEETTLLSSVGSLKVTASYADKAIDDKITITLFKGETSITSTTTSVDSGVVTFSNLTIGNDYRAAATANGYSSAEQSGIIVASGAETPVVLASLSNQYGSVSGTVQMSSGSPLSGALVLLKGTSEYTATTDENGAFAKDGIGIGSYEVTISKDGYGTLKLATAVSVESSKVTSIGTQKLTPTTAVISGSAAYADKTDSTGIAITLVDSAEQPVDSFTTTSDGQYTFSNVLPGTYKVKAGATGYSAVEKSITVAAGQGYTVALDSLTSIYGKITGTVKLQGAADYSAIQVTATGVEVYHAQTTAGGAYAIANVVPGTYALKYEKSGFLTEQSRSAAVVAGASAGVEETTLLSSVGSLKVTASYADKAIDDKITITLFKGETSITSTTTSVDSGVVTFSNLTIGNDYRVAATANGYSSAEQSGIIVASGAETPVVLASLSNQYGSVSGTVQMSSGSPLSGALVLLKGTSEYTATTDENGAFAKDGIGIGSYEVTISKDGYGTLKLATAVSVESSKVTSIGTQKLASVHGSISGRTRLQGAGDHTGILVTASGARSYTASTGADGSYSIAGMEPGSYAVAFTKAGYVNQTANVAVEADKASLVPEAMLISSSCAIAGSVVLEGSPSNSGVTVSATLVGDPSKFSTATTLEDGTYYIGGLDAGQYSIQIQMNGFVTDRSKLVYTTYGETTVIGTVVLKSIKATVRGSVTLIGTNVHTGISVMLKTQDNLLQYDTTTAQDGAFVLTSVQPGVYSLYVSKAGYESKASADITIDPSSVKTIDSISLVMAQRSIYGNVQLELKSDHAGALVTATKTSDPNKVYSAISNSAGDYSLAGMEPGEYRVVITSSGYRTLTLPTTDVIASSTANLETVDLIIARGTISGIVTLEGRSSQEGSRVELLGTGYETVTNELGEYSFSVPQGNYPGGLRFTKTDFTAGSYADTIPVLTDSTFAVPARELKATHVSVYGTVDVQGTDDDSAVRISFDNATHPEILTTDETGSFRFNHVVLGSHTIRFSRDNAPDITVQVEAGASDGINVGTMKLTPNSASIHGIVRLKDATSYSGVKVEVEVQDKGMISTFTGAGGDYYIGNIYSIGTNTVTFSKNGWDSQSTTVSGLVPLEDREMAEVTLVDTTAPVLNSIIINSGANTAANNVVTLHVDATELGSGISKMQISYDNVFDQTVTMRDYSPSYEWELPSGNGLKTVYMKLYDASGNASNVASASVTLIDQKKEVWGVLTGEDLHWTKEMSPYLVTGNIMVESDKTLTIDSGVDVQFPGAYSLTIEGTLRAIGTEAERISFYGIDNAEWDGINGVNDAENRLSHVSITHLHDGIRGYVDIDHSEISSVSEYALGNESYSFAGTARNNKIVGKIYAYEASLFMNAIQDDGAAINYSFLSGNEFSGGNTHINIYQSLGENNKFEGKALTVSYSGMINCTFASCSLSVGTGLHTRNSYSDCNFIDFWPAKVINSNLIGCELITISIESRSAYEEIDMTGNFWGYDKTREMTEKGTSSNLSFIHDYYDDFNKTKVVYSGYKSEPISGVGYMGDFYYPIVAESPTVFGIGDTGPAGGIIFHDKGFYSEGWRYLEAAPADLEGWIIFGYYKATADSYPLLSGTSHLFGSGRINTQMLVDTMGEETEYAAKLCQDYEYNGYSDWFLPSMDELYLMYKNLKVQGLGGFSGYDYWSSTENGENYAWFRNFISDEFTTYYNRVNGEALVRPIRAF